MEDERPLQEPREVLNESSGYSTTSGEVGNVGGGEKRTLTTGLLAAGGVLICILLLGGLFLPPISLASRLGLTGGDNETVAATPAATESVASGPSNIAVTSESGSVTVEAIPADAFLAGTAGEATTAMAAAVPAGMTPAGEVYLLQHDAASSGVISINMPAGDPRKLDMYGWDGAGWVFTPANHQNGQIVSLAAPLPQAVTIMSVEKDGPVAVGADLQPEMALPPEVLPFLTEVSLGRLNLLADGSLQGEVAEIATGAYKQIVQVTNVGTIVDQAAVTALLGDPALQSQNIEHIVTATADYAGVNLDYQGIPGGSRDAYSTFVADLAGALHEQGKTLIVTLGTPAPISGGGWDTAGQNWAALGQAADTVYLQMPFNPTAYTEGGAAQQLADFAVTQVDRRKLNFQVTTQAVEAIGGTFRAVESDEALQNFGALTLTEGAEEIEPGAPVEVSLAGNASPLEWDGESLMYRYTYEKDGQTYTVWLHNEAALANQLGKSSMYGVRGVTVAGLASAEQGAGYASTLDSLVSGSAAPELSGAAIAWTVEREDGSVVASSSGDALTFRWEETDLPGDYTINAEFAQGNTVALLGSIAVSVADPVEAAAPTPTAEPTAEPEGGAGVAGAVAPTAVPLDPGTADAVVGITANLRQGPSVAYPVIEVVPVGTRVTLTGRNTSAEWVQVAFDEKEGWLFASLLTINPGLDVNSLAVVEAPPLVIGGGDDGGGSPLPPPPPPIAGGSFELGGQTAGSPRAAEMRAAGMTWVKRQHKWGPGNTGNDVAGLVSDGHANGFKVLLSIPGQLNPASIDFGAYVAFLGQVAALPDPPDAIEIWNEMNIDREWPAGQISPQSYVDNMLKPAYAAIKAANPNIMVITGAPAPTGFYGGGCGGGGCDDAPYIAGMMAAGAGGASDCIGVHYNEGIMPPAATSGDPRGNGGHYTRYFQGMINAYVAAGAGQLCFTELGYLSGEEWGYVPQGFLWRAPFNLTVGEHAQYLAEAASLGANSGRVRLIIVFNVDFTSWGDDPQAGYAMIRPNGSCPACILLGQVMGTQ